MVTKFLAWFATVKRKLKSYWLKSIRESLKRLRKLRKYIHVLKITGVLKQNAMNTFINNMDTYRMSVLRNNHMSRLMETLTIRLSNLENLLNLNAFEIVFNVLYYHSQYHLFYTECYFVELSDSRFWVGFYFIRYVVLYKCLVSKSKNKHIWTSNSYLLRPFTMPTGWF